MFKSFSSVPDGRPEGFSDAYFIHVTRFVSVDGVDGSEFTWDRSVDARGAFRVRSEVSKQAVEVFC
jgi:hypothetical protein